MVSLTQLLTIWDMELWEESNIHIIGLQIVELKEWTSLVEWLLDNRIIIFR